MRTAPSLKLENLGDLQDYDDELARLREKLIADVERIQSESAHHAKRIGELNQARNELQREQSERARARFACREAHPGSAFASAEAGAAAYSPPPGARNISARAL